MNCAVFKKGRVPTDECMRGGGRTEEEGVRKRVRTRERYREGVSGEKKNTMPTIQDMESRSFP